MCMSFFQGAATHYERKMKMKSILEALYCGEIHPEATIVPANPEYRAVNRKLSEAIQMWKEKLSFRLMSLSSLRLCWIYVSSRNRYWLQLLL
ncbi:DUF6809 family protein [Paenibacillus macerans]|uniref:DUF6809 family protein n=2 Tax=Paenibacillus macerans TaxID=44252 RepID=UPI002DDD66FE|nr:DUF6809 family protein [Paenibacillus macerans]